MPAICVIIPIGLVLLFILILWMDGKLNEYHQVRSQKRAKALKAAQERSKPKELKWPDNVPRIY